MKFSRDAWGVSRSGASAVAGRPVLSRPTATAPPSASAPAAEVFATHQTPNRTAPSKTDRRKRLSPVDPGMSLAVLTTHQKTCPRARDRSPACRSGAGALGRQLREKSTDGLRGLEKYDIFKHH